MSVMKEYKYRPNVSAIIFDANKRFLMVHKVDTPNRQLDFVKGGVGADETEKEALAREIREEIGGNLEYEIINKSTIRLIYKWPKKLVDKFKYRGQDRKSYWVNFKNGEIELDNNELSSYIWLDEKQMIQKLRKDRFSKSDVDILLKEWEIIKNNNNILFNS
jgi:8-oxo-dGTP pyrophosphatase MutT (NUDIX family)